MIGSTLPGSDVLNCIWFFHGLCVWDAVRRRGGAGAAREPKHLQPSAAERGAAREEVQAHLVALTTLACHCLHSAAPEEGGDGMLLAIAHASLEVMAWSGFRDTRVAAGLLHVAAVQQAAGCLREAMYVYFSCHYRWDDWRQLSKVREFHPRGKYLLLGAEESAR